MKKRRFKKVKNKDQKKSKKQTRKGRDEVKKSALFKSQIKNFLKSVIEKIKTPEFKREAFWVLKGIVWGWTFFIILFFILLISSDSLIFILLYPGWLIIHFVTNAKPSLVTDFGPVLISILLFSFLFYCLLGAILRLIIGKIYFKFHKKSTKVLPDKKYKKKS